MRFTIRDLLWLTVVVALAVAWWAERRNTHRRVEAITKWAFQAFDSGSDPHFPPEFFEHLPPPPAAEE